MNDLVVANAVVDERRSVLADRRIAARELTRKLVAGEALVELTKTDFSKTIARRELGEEVDVPAAKKRYTAALAAVEGWEGALTELMTLISGAADLLKAAEVAAVLIEIEQRKARAEVFKTKARAAADELGRWQGAWLAEAIAAEKQHAGLNLPGHRFGQPIPFDGCAAQLQSSWDDGLGLFDVIRKHGVDAQLAPIASEIPVLPVLAATHTSDADDDEIEDDDEPGIVITAGPVGA